MLRSAGAALVVMLEPAMRRTLTGAWQRYRKHLGHGSWALRAAYLETDPPFISYRREEDHQKWLADSLPKVRRRSSIPSVVATDLLGVPENLCSLYLISDPMFWSHVSHFKARVRRLQYLSARLQIVALFSLWATNSGECHCIFTEYWENY